MNDNPHVFLSQRARVLLYAGVVALSIAASASGLANGFALDDLALIAGNARVHTLDQWWRLFALPYWPPQYGASLYRPAITIGYAIQWVVGGGSPWAFHVTSVLLYAAVSAAVLALFLEIASPFAAGVGAAFFAAHPVHVEAVANVVGQSELLAALASVSACAIYVRGRRGGRLRPMTVASIATLFAIACLSKEHALLLPVILTALEWLVLDDRPGAKPLTERARDVMPVYLALAVAGLTYLAARTMVVGELLGEKHLVPVYGVARVWVMLAVAPHWFRLLAWPAHLSADYSPQEVAVPAGPTLTTAAGLALLAGAAIVFVALGSRAGRSHSDRSLARFALAWLGITLLPVSNLFSVMLVAERTLLMPSVGAMLVAGVAVNGAWRALAAGREQRAARALSGAGVSALVILGIARSATRQAVWRDNETLFAQTVVDAPRSYRAQFFYGQMRFEQGQRADGERHLRQAIALNPTPSDVSPLNYLATQYRDAGMCPQALPLYERALANDAARPDVRYGLAACLLTVGRVDDARRLAHDGVRRGDLKSLFLDLLARSDSRSRGG